MNDIDKLCVLLPHWLDHNTEHASEFRTWAERARQAGRAHLAECIEAAAQKMEGASRDLEAAIKHLGGVAGVPSHNHAHPHHDHLQ